MKAEMSATDARTFCSTSPHAVIVTAGSISPLVHLLSTSQDAKVKKEAADALACLAWVLR